MSHHLIYQLVSDLIDIDDIMLSVNSGSGICEVRPERGLPVRIKDKWMTIGKEEKSWHIHLNLDNVKTAKFVTEIRDSGMNGYSVRFFDSKGNIVMRANFVKMYDDNGNLRSANLNIYDELFTKYGKNQVISFSD
ncbi:MAG TPA: ChuX/HutX family heme-like substrate-binding protein [Nitrososphaeraceae archaeon]|jgi:putative heme iron utilization protein|nr:ChuX/HutX family heme-like substrate-binding protein [Nitrososphaeraceae archaeon]